MSVRGPDRGLRGPVRATLDETGYDGLLGLGHVGFLSDRPGRGRRRPLGFAPPKGKRAARRKGTS